MKCLLILIGRVVRQAHFTQEDLKKIGRLSIVVVASQNRNTLETELSLENIEDLLGHGFRPNDNMLDIWICNFLNYEDRHFLQMSRIGQILQKYGDFQTMLNPQL